MSQHSGCSRQLVAHCATLVDRCGGSTRWPPEWLRVSRLTARLDRRAGTKTLPLYGLAAIPQSLRGSREVSARQDHGCAVSDFVRRLRGVQRCVTQGQAGVKGAQQADGAGVADDDA